MITTLTLTVLTHGPRPACGICKGPAAIALGGHTYCLHCTDEALERADMEAARRRQKKALAGLDQPQENP